MTRPATDSIAHELYGVLPSEFTAARNAAARELDATDRATVMAFSKPSTAAWVVNLLVRQRPDQIDQVLDLGEQLRAAQGDLDRDALAELSRQRRALVGALATNGAALAELAGHPVSAAVVDDVAQTLQAGMSDAAAAEAVRSGVLVKALEAIGLSVDLEGAVAAGPLARAPRSPVVDDLEEKRAQRRAREAEAQRAVEAAESAHEKAERVVADAVRRRDAVSDRVAEAAAALKELKAELAAAEKELKAASSARDDAASAAERARDAARDA
jgi:DNA repair exonuclease SbcCD ATPase subunit